jgi:hypothetical protein
MNSPAQIAAIDDLSEAPTRDRRDAVVNAGDNERHRPSADGRVGEASPGDRTQAIYDEIRRLDQARADGTSVLTERNADNPRNQAATTAGLAIEQPVLDGRCYRYLHDTDPPAKRPTNAGAW